MSTLLPSALRTTAKFPSKLILDPLDTNFETDIKFERNCGVCKQLDIITLDTTPSTSVVKVIVPDPSMVKVEPFPAEFPVLGGVIG